MKLCIAVLSSAFLLAAGAFAQKKAAPAMEKTQTTEKTTDAGTTKTKSHSAIGKVKEAHAWSNRPIWDTHGIDRPEGSSPAPENLNWELWLGVAPYPERIEQATVRLERLERNSARRGS